MQRHYSGAAEALLAVVKDDVLSRRRATEWLREADERSTGIELNAASNIGLPITDLGAAFEGRRRRLPGYPVR